MIQMLFGNTESAAAAQKAIGQKIERMELIDDVLTIKFESGYKIALTDEGQSCCETRYMRTDEDLDDYIGATLTSIEVANAPSMNDNHGEPHDVQFLRVHTSAGIAVFSSHNEHNGYYGGFSIQAKEVSK